MPFDAHRVEKNSHYFRCDIVQGEVMSSEPVESYCIAVAHSTCNACRGKVFYTMVENISIITVLRVILKNEFYYKLI